MRTFALLLMNLLFILSSSWAQPLVQDGNQWNIAIYPTFSPNTSTYALRIDGDTIIDDQTYKLVYRSSDLLSWHLINQYLREDQEGKVYLKTIAQPEMVLYDFSLVEGEQFLVNGNCTLAVVEVSDITLNNGSVRKRLKQERAGNPDWGFDYWIEGIGSVRGLLTHFDALCMTDYNEGLLCHYQNAELVFPENPTACYITSISTINAESPLRLYPNPVGESLMIEVENDRQQLQKVSLYDAMGRMVLQKEITHLPVQIPVHHLPAGTFYARIDTEDGIYFDRFIKLAGNQ